MSFINDVTKTIGKVGNIVKKSYGPLAALEIPAIDHLKSYRYPLDVGSGSYPHTVEFQCYKPNPKPIGQAATEAGNKLLNAIQGNVVKAVDIGGPLINRHKANQVGTTYMDFTRDATPQQLIAMYLPVAWEDTSSNDYADQSMTELLGNFGLAASVMNSIKKAWDTGEWASDTGAIAAEVVGKISKFGDNGGLAQAGIQTMGYAMNPQFEMLYNRSAFREFTFQFNMVPRNRTEAQEILDIINIFKYHASPEYTDGSGRYMIPPSYFDIIFKYQGTINTKLPRISTCVCKQVQVNYSPNTEAFATFDDGQPIQINLNITFGELEIIHKALRDPTKPVMGEGYF
jgi:hypothetical protein